MTSLVLPDQVDEKVKTQKEENFLRSCVNKAWKVIAPAWPVNQLIATNPLQGFEEMPFEEAFHEASFLFRRKDFPKELERVNTQMMKWCQAFFDRGQSSLKMPYKDEGFYSAWLKLASYDDQLHHNHHEKEVCIASLSHSPLEAIKETLIEMKIPEEKWERFLTLLLALLPGWASHVKYCSEWERDSSFLSKDQLLIDYLAVRVCLTFVLWPSAVSLLEWDKKVRKFIPEQQTLFEKINQNEKKYTRKLLELLERNLNPTEKKDFSPKAQFVFCIDVRSEPFRKAIESVSDYETFGFAGFFGVPVEIENPWKKKREASCPVIVEPAHTVQEKLSVGQKGQKRHKSALKAFSLVKKAYQSVKYTFYAPFALVETLGPFAGLIMGLKSFHPRLFGWLLRKFQSLFKTHISMTVDIESIPFENQLTYARSALKTMGLTENFSPFVFLCGHGSQTENNAYQSALNCGACAGRNGKKNAQILALILNQQKIRNQLSKEGIQIPQTTCFIAAVHNTTTDELDIDTDEVDRPDLLKSLGLIKKNLRYARQKNNQWRLEQLCGSAPYRNTKAHTNYLSSDWAQVRPEWGLAKNASFIVGPRSLTKYHSLFGRSFLQSYNPHLDPSGEILEGILLGPMKVAYWINSQYLFSSLDNSAFGGGSKITKNIVGLSGVMQGNSSDLMHGLPWQSLSVKPTVPYHEPQRLLSVLYAPKERILMLIEKHSDLKQLFRNEWLKLYCMDPKDHQIYTLTPELDWKLLMKDLFN